MQAPVASRAPTSGPERRNTPAKYRDYQCFRPDGGEAGATFGCARSRAGNRALIHPRTSAEVWCFCNTEPRIKAIRRVTRKESSPNLGRSVPHSAFEDPLP